jgi:hypothetical protein
MSAASPAGPVRRPAATAQPARHPVRTAPSFKDSSANEDALRLNLGDLPRMDASLDVEGFKPSLLSRLFDLLSPVKR